MKLPPIRPVQIISSLGLGIALAIVANPQTVIEYVAYGGAFVCMFLYGMDNYAEGLANGSDQVIEHFRRLKL